MPNPHFHHELDYHMSVNFTPVQIEPRVRPQDGGCWFCFKTHEEGMVFSSEFDTNVHLGCIEELTEPEDSETAIFNSEFKDALSEYRKAHPKTQP